MRTRPNLFIPATLALALLAGGTRTVQAQAPAVGTPATPEIKHKLEKSLLLSNHSSQPWTLGLYAAETGAPVGTTEANTYDPGTGRLTSKGEFSPTRPIPIAPGEWVAITPVPEKSVASRLGLSRRVDYRRELFLKDTATQKVDFSLFRTGDDTGGGKAPTLTFAHLDDFKAYQGKVFSLDSGPSSWLTINRPTLH